MARFDFSHVNVQPKVQPKIDEFDYMDLDDIMSEHRKLCDRWKEILKLPPDEFLSDKISKELDYIHHRTSELSDAILRGRK